MAMFGSKWNFINSKYVDGLQFVPVTFPMNKPDALLVENLQIDQLVEYINRKDLKKAYLSGMSDFEILRKCPRLEHITIEFNLPFRDYASLPKKRGKFYKEYDSEPIYTLAQLKTLNIITGDAPALNETLTVDFSRLKDLRQYHGNYCFIENMQDQYAMQTLVLNHYPGENLTGFGHMKDLDTLELSFSKVQTLDGAESLNRLQCLTLKYNRSLHDISALAASKKTLKSLNIQNCSQINDFSVLGELENLQKLQLWGSNVLPNLDFLKGMPNLKTFVFDVEVANGDLSGCMNLAHVACAKFRKHYNCKKQDLPISKPVICGNEDIEEWRRLE